MPEWHWVKDTITGHRYATRNIKSHHEVLDEVAVDANGLPRRPKLMKRSPRRAEPIGDNQAEAATVKADKKEK